MYEVADPRSPEIGVYASSLEHARSLAQPGDEVWQVADDTYRTRMVRIPDEVVFGDVATKLTDRIEAQDEPPCSDPRPDPLTHPEYWRE